MYHDLCDNVSSYMPAFPACQCGFPTSRQDMTQHSCSVSQLENPQEPQAGHSPLGWLLSRALWQRPPQLIQLNMSLGPLRSSATEG